MNKPTKHTIECYDYFEASAYLQEKYGYDERDYLGHFDVFNRVRPQVLAKYGIIGDSLRGLPADTIIKINREVEAQCPPYRDFWHFLCLTCNVPNGGRFVMREEWFEDAEDWQREIGMRYLDEFGEGQPGERTINFWGEW